MLMCPTCRRSQAFTGVHGRSRAFTGVKNFKNFKVFNYLTTYGYGYGSIARFQGLQGF